MIVEIENIKQFLREINTPGVVLADYYADWCEPCKWVDVILEKLDSQLPKGCSIVKIDTEKHEDLRLKYDIRSVPVLIIFKNGVEVWRMNGFLVEQDLLNLLLEFSRET